MIMKYVFKYLYNTSVLLCLFVRLDLDLFNGLFVFMIYFFDVIVRKFAENTEFVCV